MGILSEQLQLVRSPRAAITRLAIDPQSAFIGLRHVLILAVLYEVAIALWAFGDATPTLPAFLKIPDERYYVYELTFIMPMILTAWLLSGGIAHLASKALGGNGSYDAILGGFGIATLVSTYFTLIPDFVQGALWTMGWVPFASYQEATSHGLLLVMV